MLREDECRICDLYTNGESYKTIKDITGCSYSTIKRIRKKYNLTTNQRYEILNDYAVINIVHNGKNFKVKIDIEDVEKCKRLGKWSITKQGYVFNSHKKILLSRYVMECPDGYRVDHIHHDLLDNRKSELRVCRPYQNSMNCVIGKNNKSGVTGVYWDSARNMWSVQIQFNGIRKQIGRFNDFNDAVKARKEAEIKYFKEYRYLGD